MLVGSDFKPIRLLLIEDNPKVSRMVCDRFTATPGRRFEIGSAESLDRCLERLCSSHFDLVLRDLLLPDSAGNETIPRLHLEVRRFRLSR
jgi:response regulator of citrate/malate metabolism